MKEKCVQTLEQNRESFVLVYAENRRRASLIPPRLGARLTAAHAQRNVQSITGVMICISHPVFGESFVVNRGVVSFQAQTVNPHWSVVVVYAKI